MVSLNDYLYNGDTILKIVRNYLNDLNSKAETAIDRTHSNFLIMYNEYLANNEFIDYQSSVLANFCSKIIERHPELSFTLRGRIKSLIRLEEKYNRYICTYVEEYYKKNNDFPSDNQIKAYLNRFRDIIAYRYVINIPKCHLKNPDNKEAEELSILYEIANSLPDYLSRNNLEVKPFADLAEVDEQVKTTSHMLWPDNLDFIKDYVENPKKSGYRSLHLSVNNPSTRSDFEIQIRTKQMDDFAEIGEADHSNYEKRQAQKSACLQVPNGQNKVYDQALMRLNNLINLDLSKVDVDMFTCYGIDRMNDACGLFKGRLILPIEKLSKYEN